MTALPAIGGVGKIALDPTGLRASARKLRDARAELDVDATRLASKPVPVMPDGVAAAVGAELAAIAADIRAQSVRAGAAADELDWRVLVAEVDDALRNNAPLSAATIALLTRELTTGHPRSHVSGREAANIAYALHKIEGNVGFTNGVGRYLSWMNGTAGWDGLLPDSPLADYAALLTLEHFPTMNNGRIFGALAGQLSKLPGPAGRAGEFLSDATRATPFFRGFGIAANVVGTGVGVYDTARDWHKGGAQLATDITGTAFNARRSPS